MRLDSRTGMVASWQAGGMVLDFLSVRESPGLKPIPLSVDLKIQLFDLQQEDLNRPSWSFVGPTVCNLMRFSIFSGCADGVVRIQDQCVFVGVFRGQHSSLLVYRARLSAAMLLLRRLLAVPQEGDYSNMI